MLAAVSGDPSASDSNTWVAGDSLSRRTSGDDPDPVLERGRALGRYVVLARLGSGGMGVVYAAYDPELDRKVALKLLHGAKDDAQPRLLREAQAMARLSHPSVVTVHDVGTVEGRIYVAMEFIDGLTLRDWLDHEKDAPFERRLEILRLAGEGLAAAHGQELVHRDFKPDNVMVGNDGRVRVLDFGLARATGETAEEVAIRQESADLSTSASSKALSVELTRTGAFLGTPRYMAPEQFEGRDADARADQYAFALTAWEVLYGKRPFSGDSAAASGLARSIGKLTPPPRSTDSG